MIWIELYGASVALAFVGYIIMRVMTDSSKEASAGDWFYIIAWPIWVLAAIGVVIGTALKAKQATGEE